MDDRSTIRVEWFIGLFGLFISSLYAYHFLLAVNSSALLELLVQKTSLSAYSLTMQSVSFYFAVALFYFPLAFFLNRHSVLTILILACGLLCISSLLFFMTHATSLLILDRFVLGLSFTTVFIACLKFSSARSSFHAIAYFFIVLTCLSFVLAFFFTASFNFIMRAHSEDFFAYIRPIASFLFVVVFLFFICGIKKTEQQFEFNIVIGLRHVLSNKNLWLANLYSGLMFGPLLLLASLWGVPYLLAFEKFTVMDASGAVSLIYLGVVFGVALYSLAGHYFRSRRIFMVLGAFLSFVISTILLYMPGFNLTAMYSLCFLFGVFHSVFVVIYMIANESVDAEAKGAAMGFSHTFLFLSCGLFQVLACVLMAQKWLGLDLYGQHILRVNEYQHALLIIPVAEVLALLVAVFLYRESYRRC
jgi:hypothetical protein